MTGGRWTRLTGRVGIRFLPLLVSGWWGLGVPVPAASQSQQEIQQRTLEYEVARAAVELRTREWDAQQQLLQSALAELDVAKRSENSGRIEVADRRVMAAATQLDYLKRLVQDAQRDLATKRTARGNAIERYASALLTRRAGATAAERADLDREIAYLDGEYEVLQAEARSSSEQPTLLYLPGARVELDPRMTNTQIANMVGLIDRTIREVREQIERVDDQIAGLRTLVQRQRLQGDRATTLGRFDATQPVGANTPRNPAGGEAAAPPLSAQEQIAQLTTYRGVLQDMMLQLDQRVVSIRRDHPGIGGPQ
jgi:hypothetical protein